MTDDLTDLDARNEVIIKLRNDGALLRPLGAAFGLSHERVRTIAFAGGAETAGALADKYRTAEWTCPRCGETYRGSPGLIAKLARRRHCSRGCRAQHRLRIGADVVTRRLAGARWMDIRESLDGKRRRDYNRLSTLAKQYLDNVGASPEVRGQVFPGRHEHDGVTKTRMRQAWARRRARP